MQQLSQFIMLSDASAGYYLIDFLVILAFMAAVRLLANSMVGSSLKELLTEQDNFAAGITLAGAIIAVSILMMGVASGEAGHSYVDEFSLMAIYGVGAILFMLITRKVFDRVVLTRMDLHQEMLKGNTSTAIVDAGNMIATATNVRAAMSWVDGSTYLGMVVVAVIFVVSQLLMVAATVYRTQVFQSRHKESGRTLQGEIQGGNMAVAVRFAGHRLGVALAVTAASGVVIYAPDSLFWSIAAWSLVAVVMFFAQTLFSIGLRQLLLPGVNIGQEVGVERNVAIGSIEAGAYIGAGLVFVGLLG